MELSGWLALPPVVAILLAVAVAPVRRGFLNGWRCLLRYRVMWVLPAVFALGGIFFDLSIYLLVQWRTSTPLDFSIPGEAMPVQAARDAVVSSILPAVEGVDAALNCLISTFPISGLLALVFLTGASRLTGELWKGLWRRFGWMGAVLFLGIVLCALGGLLKPVYILALPEITGLHDIVQYFPRHSAVALGAFLNAFSFVFEYLLGTCAQVYLLLIALGWVLGKDFDRKKLWGFAVRRLGVVIKWSLVMIALTLLVIHLPFLVECLSVDDPLEWKMPHFAATWSRPILAAVMLLFATVQIRLVLHTDSLLGAVRAHMEFVRRNAFPLVVFLVAAIVMQWIVRGFEAVGTSWLGYTMPGLGWLAVFQLFSAFAGGWTLASWVCFYKICESGKEEPQF